MGASVASETTAAATGAVGVLRRDPMAMKPFCGYHFGDYWQHWIDVGKSLRQPPKVFHVNWFRQDAEGRFLWPGFGENLRVLAWILDRVSGRTDAADTPIGRMPRVADLPLDGLSLDSSHLAELLAVDTQGWHAEYARLREEFSLYGDRVPVELSQRLDSATAKLEAQPSQR